MNAPAIIKMYIYSKHPIRCVMGRYQSKNYLYQMFEFDNICFENGMKIFNNFTNINDNTTVNVSENELTNILERLQSLASNYAIYVLDELKKMLSHRCNLDI